MTISGEPSAAKLVLARRRDQSEPGHYWIYAGFVQPASGEVAAGDLVDVVRPDGRFYARGLYNPASKIRVRILTFQDEPVDEAFWRARIARAVRLRKRLVSGTDAYRLIYGEADFLPGLIADRYGDVLVLQTLSAGMDRRKERLAELLCEESGAARVFLRNDAKSRALEGLPVETGFLKGSGATTVEVHEGQARFVVDFGRGQKTGWFCDQRQNRLDAAMFAPKADVLEVFCHTGAFGIHAALAGAVSVEESTSERRRSPPRDVMQL